MQRFEKIVRDTDSPKSSNKNSRTVFHPRNGIRHGLHPLVDHSVYTPLAALLLIFGEPSQERACDQTLPLHQGNAERDFLSHLRDQPVRRDGRSFWVGTRA
jgi:hypothetical protein